MRVLELFSGTGSFSNVCKERGHEVFTVDIDAQFKPDMIADISNIVVTDIPFKPDVVWASPPCECFSVASIGSNWIGDYEPKTKKTKDAINLVRKTLSLIDGLEPDFWFIENPRGVLRKMSFMKELPITTVCYCQYGDNRMKPTDIWNNIGFVGKMCRNGSADHIASPRGSKTGTQGLYDRKERGIIPRGLCEEICIVCEEELKQKLRKTVKG